MDQIVVALIRSLSLPYPGFHSIRAGVLARFENRETFTRRVYVKTVGRTLTVRALLSTLQSSTSRQSPCYSSLLRPFPTESSPRRKKKKKKKKERGSTLNRITSNVIKKAIWTRDGKLIRNTYRRTSRFGISGTKNPRPSFLGNFQC